MNLPGFAGQIGQVGTVDNDLVVYRKISAVLPTAQPYESAIGGSGYEANLGFESKAVIVAHHVEHIGMDLHSKVGNTTRAGDVLVVIAAEAFAHNPLIA